MLNIKNYSHPLMGLSNIPFNKKNSVTLATKGL